MYFAISVVDYLLLSIFFVQLYFITTGPPANSVHSITQPRDVSYRNTQMYVVWQFRRAVTLSERSQDKWGQKKNTWEYKLSCSMD